MRNDVARAVALRGAIVLAATVVTLGLLAGLSGRAQAEIDISGDWILDVQGAYSDNCAVALQQSGTELTAEIDCSIGSGTLIGTIDPSTGSFTLAGNVGAFGVDLQGAASQDGESVSGTWDVRSYEVSGTFSGTRGVAPPTPTPGGPEPLSGPFELDAGLALPDTGSGPRDASGNGPPALLFGAVALLVAVSGLGLRLRLGRRRRNPNP